MKHTKGPWRLIRDGEEPKDGWPVVQFRDWSVFSPPMHCDSLGSQEADAQLIAAAPEMLELLHDYRALYETYSMQDMSEETLRGELSPEVFKKVIKRRNRIAEVISKAEGR